MSTCLVLPTRGRPHFAVAAVKCFTSTITRMDTYLTLAVDDDDPNRDDYLRLVHDVREAWPMVSVVVNQRMRMGPTLNHVAVARASSYDVIGFMGDDHRLRTPGWDEAVHVALADGPGVAYGDDFIHGPNLPTAVFVSGRLVRDLGYMAPPGLVHLYLDNFWLELGRATRLRYLPDVVIEHMHPIAGKSEWDAGYEECNSGDVQQHDATEFQRYMRDDWPTERMKLGSAAVH